MAEVKQDVSEHTKHIEEAEGSVTAAEEELEKVQEELASTVKRLAYLETKTDDLENRSKRENLRMFGLREGAEGTPPLLDYIWEMLPKWLELSVDQTPVLERVHCTLAPVKPNQHRAVLICLWKYQDRETVYRLSSQKNILHDGIQLTLVQDFSAEMMRRCREFNTARKLFTEMGMFRGFQLNPCKMRVVHNRKMVLFTA